MHWAQIIVGQKLGTGFLGRKCMKIVTSVVADVEQHLHVQLLSMQDWKKHIGALRIAGWLNMRQSQFDDIPAVLECLQCLGVEKPNITTGFSFRLRLSKDHEELYGALVAEKIPENPAAVRRLVATYPLWTTECVKDLDTEKIKEWVTNRVIPHVPGRKVQKIIDGVCTYLTISSVAISIGVYDIDRALDKFNIAAMPIHVSVFWGHFFGLSPEDELMISDIAQRIAQHSVKHQQQFWESVKACCLFTAHCLGIRPKSISVTRFFSLLTTPQIKQWLQLQHPSVVIRNKIALNTFIGMGYVEHCTQMTMSFKRCVQTWTNRAPSMATFTEDEVTQLLRHACTHRDRAMLLLLSRTGLRSKAFRSLLRAHVGSSVGVAKEKGGKLHRFHIDEDTARSIALFLKDNCNVQSQYLFPNPRYPCQPLTVSQLRQWLIGISTRAGVFGPHVTVHSFRRYVVTALVNAGNSLDLVARYVGHCTSTTTSGYWRTSPHELANKLALPWHDSRSAHKVRCAFQPNAQWVESHTNARERCHIRS